MPAANSEKKLVLIGAGLVGSLLAVLLARRGFTVDIYERRPDMRETDISAGRSINLALANRGIRPLEAAGVMEQVWPILTKMEGRMIHDQKGDTNFQPYGQRPEEVIYSVSRGDLNKICMNAAEATGNVTIHFNQKCTAVDFEKNQFTVEQVNSGETQNLPFEHIIGTDGSASAVREAIHQRHSQQHDILPLGHSYKELTIEPGENGAFLMADNALHIWPRGQYMLIALPNADASFTVTLFLPNEGENSFQQLTTAESVDAFFSEQFADAKALMPNLTDMFFANPTGHLATVKCAPWHYQEKALLLGDAAHAIVPFHGQGMNAGFEDALQFSELLDKHGDDWQTLFAETDKQRKPNADAIADMAIENYIEMRDSVRDPKFLLRKALAFELEKQFPDRFCPRYSMVMFHHLPYAEAKARGEIQSEILTTLTENHDDLDSIDMQRAEQLVVEKLAPWR